MGWKLIRNILSSTAKVILRLINNHRFILELSYLMIFQSSVGKTESKQWLLENFYLHNASEDLSIAMYSLTFSLRKVVCDFEKKSVCRHLNNILPPAYYLIVFIRVVIHCACRTTTNCSLTAKFCCIVNYSLTFNHIPRGTITSKFLRKQNSIYALVETLSLIAQLEINARSTVLSQ